MGLIELIAAVALVFINLALFMDLKRIHEEQKETRRILVRIKNQLNKQELKTGIKQREQEHSYKEWLKSQRQA